jgi:hypothetical protein
MSQEDDLINELILQGAIEIAAIDSETGEFLYSFTEKINDVSPELAQNVNQAFNDDIMLLWQAGMIDVNWLDQTPMVKLTDKAFIKNEINNLSPQLKTTLEVIKSALKID